MAAASAAGEDEQEEEGEDDEDEDEEDAEVPEDLQELDWQEQQWHIKMRAAKMMGTRDLGLEPPVADKRLICHSASRERRGHWSHSAVL